MRRARVATATALVVSVAGCVALQTEPPRASDVAEGHIALDWTSSRLVGPPSAEDFAAGRVHTYADLQARQLSRFRSRVTQNLARGGPVELDWNVPTDAPVTAPAAVLTTSLSSATNASDAFFFATNAASKGITAATGAASIANYTAAMATANFFKLKFIYNAIPTVAWYVDLGQGVDGSGITFSDYAPGRVFALTSSKLHCFLVAQAGEPASAAAAPVALTTANECAGFPVTPGGAFSKSSPWVEPTNGAVFVGNLSGTLFRYNFAGTLVWSLALGGGAIHSDPIEYNNNIVLGTDSGYVYFVQDTATGATTPTVLNFPVGANPIYGSGVIDTVGNTVYFAANDTIFSGSLSSGTQSSRALGSGNNGIIYSSPSMDYTNGYLYLGFNNRLFKAAYPVAAGSALYSTPTAYQSSDTTFPHASPLVYNGNVYVGTSGSGSTGGGGSLEEYACATAATAPVLTSLTTPYGGLTGTSASSDTAPVIDYSSGNVNFGYGTTSGTGGVVQISMSALTAAKQCPSGMASSPTGCGSTTPACITGASCADRPSNAGSTVCGVFAEDYNTNASISCPSGTTIVGVKFASYGTATGTCAADNLAVNTACHSETSQSAFLALCAGQTTCSFGANSTVFGTPCAAAQGSKYFAVKAICDVSNTKVCSSAHIQSAACSAGAACTGTCDTGYADCDANKATNGCETNTQTSATNCGACGTVCSSNHVTRACAGGSCSGGTCAAGFADCNGNKQTDGCETTLAGSPAGCGAGACCGATCASGTACIQGTCTAGYTACSTSSTVDENGSVTITCPPGTVVSAIPFASYGTPTGTCPTFATGTCDGSNSVSVVSTACMGQSSCTVAASNATFGDPCVGTFKRLYVRATCAAPSGSRCP